MDSPPKFRQLHFAMIPLMSPGHIIPMMDMARLLAHRGVDITVITTPLNAVRFASSIPSESPIRILQVRFPSAEAGLPDGCESIDSIPCFQLMPKFLCAIDLLQDPIQQLIQDLNPHPDCILCDKHISWTSDLADKLKIPRIIFDGMSCFTQLCTHNLLISKAHESVPKWVPFVVPGLPDRIEVTRSQLPGIFNPGSMNVQQFRERVVSTEGGAYGVIINSFEELEQDYANEFRKAKAGKVWCIGPLSLNNTDNLARRGRDKASIDENHCLKWLDSWPNGTVIYACLGSLSRLSSLQLIELALALEASDCPFIWVVRAGERTQEVEKWIKEDGFEERTKNRGLLIRGWAQQVLMLSHPAIGGFLTHCGWNSTLEGISAGVPMITWPLFSEQFLNEKLVVQVLKIGVSVGAQAVVHLGEEEESGVRVKRVEIVMALKNVMNRESGEERRERARKLGERAKRAVEEGGSSHLNITLLIQDIMQHHRNDNGYR